MMLEVKGVFGRRNGSYRRKVEEVELGEVGAVGRWSSGEGRVGRGREFWLKHQAGLTLQ